MVRLGSFKPVAMERKKADLKLTVLSREHLGAYHKIAPVITEVEAWARAHGEKCAVTFGQYFDNPDTTDEDRLRSRGGCILETELETEKLRKLLGETENAAGGPTTSTTTRIETIEIGDAIVASFDGSPAIAPTKVYPKAHEMMNQLDLRSSGPVLELYEVVTPTEGRTRYYFPVESSRK